MIERAIEVFRHEGKAGLFTKIIQYLQWLFQYRLLASLISAFVNFRGGEVRIEGLQVDTDSDQITPQTVYRIVTGEYERPERILISRHLDPNMDVVELGGGLGLTACHANRSLSGNRKHIVLEANENLVPTIERNRFINSQDFKVINAAYHPCHQSVTFATNDTFESGRIVEDQEESTQVDAISLHRLSDDFDLTSFTLIADIEGTEFDIVKNEQSTLIDHCETMIVEVHPHHDMSISSFQNEMHDAGFELVDRIDDVLAFKKNSK